MRYPFARATGKIDHDGQKTDFSGLAKGSIFRKTMCERPSRQSHQSVPASPDHSCEIGCPDMIFNGATVVAWPSLQVARMAAWSAKRLSRLVAADGNFEPEADFDLDGRTLGMRGAAIVRYGRASGGASPPQGQLARQQQTRPPPSM